MRRRLDQAEIAALKVRLPLSVLIGERVEWDRRRSNPARGDWWACCPFHAERTPSFHVDDRKGFYHCFGCSASGDHFTWCRDMLGDDFPRAVDRLLFLLGVCFDSVGWERQRRLRLSCEASRSHIESAREAPARPRRQATQTTTDLCPDQGPARAARPETGPRFGLAEARRIWRAARPGGRVLMDYLAARGVRIGVLEARWGGPPPAIRLHPDLPYWEGGRVVHRGPAMVALIGWPQRPVGVHRTWITPEGRARHPRTGRKLDKRWLGRTGAMFGSPVRITAHSRRMIVGEGIETVLAAWSLLAEAADRGRGRSWSAEAALSLGALTGRADHGFGRDAAMPDWHAPGWRAPDWVEELIILGEGSAKAPREAARRFEMARRRHAWRSDGTPRRCRVILPEGGWGSDLDFADVAARDRTRGAA